MAVGGEVWGEAAEAEVIVEGDDVLPFFAPILSPPAIPCPSIPLKSGVIPHPPHPSHSNAMSGLVPSPSLSLLTPMHAALSLCFRCLTS